MVRVELALLLGLVSVGVGCGGDPNAVDLDESPTSTGPDPTSTTSATSNGATSNATSTSGLPDPDGGSLPPGGGTLDGAGESSGGVEDTVFGMSDDMPLVADIPDIKHGLLGSSTWVLIEQVRPTTGKATYARESWFYVQDPTFAEHMGLRVLLPPGDAVPDPTRVVDLEGWVQLDAQGWLLELDSVVEGGPAEDVSPRQVSVFALTSVDAVALDDALVEVTEPSGLVVRRRGTSAGTVIVGGTTTRGVVLVDLRPFGLDLDLAPGTRLSLLRGVAEIGGPQAVILPRSGDDLVIVQ